MKLKSGKTIRRDNFTTAITKGTNNKIMLINGLMLRALDCSSRRNSTAFILGDCKRMINSGFKKLVEL